PYRRGYSQQQDRRSRKRKLQPAQAHSLKHLEFAKALAATAQVIEPGLGGGKWQFTQRQLSEDRLPGTPLPLRIRILLPQRSLQISPGTLIAYGRCIALTVMTESSAHNGPLSSAMFRCSKCSDVELPLASLPRILRTAY